MANGSCSPPELIDTLRQRNLEAAAADIAIKSGLEYRPLKLGESVAGIYRERLSLPSGRFALIEDGLGFSLVPWKPSLERHLGQHACLHKILLYRATNTRLLPAGPHRVHQSRLSHYFRRDANGAAVVLLGLVA